MFINVTAYQNINKIKEHFEIDVNKEQWLKDHAYFYVIIIMSQVQGIEIIIG